MLTAKQVEALIRGGLPAAAEQGVVVESVGENRARVRYRFTESMIRPGGTVSGPTLMSLADAPCTPRFSPTWTARKWP